MRAMVTRSTCQKPPPWKRKKNIAQTEQAAADDDVGDEGVEVGAELAPRDGE